MVKADNYVNIQGWMSKNLGLKGNNLIIYAIIFGFSQVEGHYFNGSLQYLGEWTNSTRQGVIKNLKELVDTGLIIKQEASPTNIYYVNRAIIDEVNNVESEVNNVDTPLNKVDTDSKQSLHNTRINHSNTQDKYIREKEFQMKVQSILTYFNSVCGTKFKNNSKTTQQLIRRRFNEGFTEEDFKKVIDTKYKEWGVSPKPFANGMMSNAYLRPTTLFGDKFETYLYEANLKESSEPQFNSVSTEIDKERSNLVF